MHSTLVEDLQKLVLFRFVRYIHIVLFPQGRGIKFKQVQWQPNSAQLAFKAIALLLLYFCLFSVCFNQWSGNTTQTGLIIMKLVQNQQIYLFYYVSETCFRFFFFHATATSIYLLPLQIYISSLATSSLIIETKNSNTKNTFCLVAFRSI